MLYSGSFTASLTITGSGQAQDGFQFECQISTANGCAVLSTTATLHSGSLRSYVNANAAPGGDGTSWATAFTDLNSALQQRYAVVAYGCPAEIWVAGGIYNSGGTYQIYPAGLTIYGGFSGVETDLSQRNVSAHPTILNGNPSLSLLATTTFVGFGNYALSLDGFIVQNAQIGINNNAGFNLFVVIGDSDG